MVLYVALALTGELAARGGYPRFLLAVRVFVSAALWATVVLLVVLEGLGEGGNRGKAIAAAGTRRRIRDFIAMTRPMVTVVLLVTAYTGMLSAGGGLPDISTTLWTLIGLAFAVGGAQAINQFMDRDIDAVMNRTAQRPLPSGRLTPAEGLAWGLVLCVASFYILTVFVSGATAALAALGSAWYVILYTGTLKRRTPYGVVLGGGAGALMPLVGCVAASGRLTGEAALLSAVVFLWTPPHFWSLTMLHQDDYTKAKVPVLPMVAGERRTLNSILVYSLIVTAASVILTITAAKHWWYIVTAIILGAFLCYRAWLMRIRELSLAAARMYRYSSVYLGLFLAATAADLLI
jgi:protoheme IX farnesyltransferase